VAEHSYSKCKALSSNPTTAKKKKTTKKKTKDHTPFTMATVKKSENKQKKWTLWLTSLILATWEAEIGRISVQGQPRQIVQETPSPK
jgi:hypothetical protein